MMMMMMMMMMMHKKKNRYRINEIHRFVCFDCRFVCLAFQHLVPPGACEMRLLAFSLFWPSTIHHLTLCPGMQEFSQRMSTFPDSLCLCTCRNIPLLGGKIQQDFRNHDARGIFFFPLLCLHRHLSEATVASSDPMHWFSSDGSQQCHLRSAGSGSEIDKLKAL